MRWSLLYSNIKDVSWGVGAFSATWMFAHQFSHANNNENISPFLSTGKGFLIHYVIMSKSSERYWYYILIIFSVIRGIYCICDQTHELQITVNLCHSFTPMHSLSLHGINYACFSEKIWNTYLHVYFCMKYIHNACITSMCVPTSCSGKHNTSKELFTSIDWIKSGDG